MVTYIALGKPDTNCELFANKKNTNDKWTFRIKMFFTLLNAHFVTVKI